MKISVVVPFRNAERTIGRCVDALLNQDDPGGRVEIIMVDHRSTDGSAGIVRRHAAIQLLSEAPGAGVYAARNRGVAAARGAVVAFTDPDCVPARDWLKAIAEVTTDGGLQVVLGRRDPANDSKMLSLLSAYELAKDEYVLSGTLPELYYGYANNMAVRRELFDELGLFPEVPRGADTIFVRRVVDRYSCNAVRYSPEIRIRHLEMDGVRAYYRKMFIYGRHRRLNRGFVNAAPLSLSQRVEVLRRARRVHGRTAVESTELSALLAAGLVAWQLGRLSGVARPTHTR